jgi:hypothetical protein
MGFRPAGRKRKGFRREPSGRLQRKTQVEIVEETVRIARNQPHRRGLKSKDRVNELAESELGRLSLRGIISTNERAAGETFAAIVGAYRAVIEGPRQVRSLMPETASERQKSAEELASAKFDCPSQYIDPIDRQVIIGGRAIMVREWPCQRPGEVCACAERRNRYMRAYEAASEAGRGALLDVIRTAVRGEPPLSIVNLKRGLSALQRFLGLTERGEGSNGRNRLSA